MNGRYENILLDLDGTVIDSGEGITKCVQYALKALGIEVTELSELYPFIGPPLQESFRSFYHLSERQIEFAVNKYRERYEEKGIYENVLYEGIPELLEKWNRKGKRVILCTSKPEIFAVRILEDYQLRDDFAFIGGATLDGKRNTKSEVIAYSLQKCRIEDKAGTIMVGDRKYDIEGAKQLGLDSAGVLYGYGDRAEFLKAGADYIVENVFELGELIS